MKQVNLRIYRMILPLLLGMFLSLGAYAQTVSVKGHVKDAFGEPVIGANVVVKGSSVGTITDIDGNFTLNAPLNSTIEVSFIGYKTVEVQAAASVMVTLQDDTVLLEEAVIIGYGTVKKSDMTGSVTAIKAEEINRGAISSPEQLLQGKVPGLLVTPASGAPGESATIRIRGAASLYASNDPLIVIDGVPVTPEGGAGMGNPLSSINPNDIESYTVLKDASATAIYGSRASNGVIIITTKKGTGQKTQVSYNSSYSLKQNTSTMDVMTGDQYRAYMTEHYGTDTERGKNIQKLMGDANTDWQDLIYRTAFSTDQNVSLYGNAGNVLPYRVSVGYNYDEAALKVGDNQRGTVDISLSPKFFKDHLTVNVNAKGIYNRTNFANLGAISDAIAFTPTQSPYFTNSDGSVDYTNCNGYWNWLSSDGSANTMASINPLSQMYDNYNVNETFRSLGNVQLDYKIHGFEDLRLNLNLGYDVAETTGKTHTELGSILSKRNAAADYLNDYKNYNKNLLLEFYGNYNKEFGIHRLDAMAGYSWQHNYVRYNQTRYYNNNRDEVYLKAPQDAREYFLVSFFGRINYSINSKYLFTFSLRDDASSRFSKDKRWGLFPAAAFAWNVSEENFLRDSQTISSLKLRLSWGRTGQQDIGMNNCYAYQARYTESSALVTQIPWGSGWLTTLAPNAYNPNIKWETTETYNVGIDFGFLRGRINGSVDAYLRKTFDLLNDVSASLGSNFSNRIISNVGDMENKGVELNINFIPIEKRDMRWTINFNSTWQKTEMIKLTKNQSDDYKGVERGAGMGGTGGYTSLYRVGYTPHTYHLYQQAYDENGNALQNVLVDRDGDGKITENDRYVTGKSITPKFYFGLGSQFSYKNWDFGFNAHASFGGYALNRITMNNSTSYSDDHTKGYINNLSTYVLKTGWLEPNNEQQKYSDMFLENASFFKMDDINIGYTFDKIGNWKGKIRVGASVQNVFTVTNYSGLDPELTTSDGVDQNLIPRPRFYTIRLNVNF